MIPLRAPRYSDGVLQKLALGSVASEIPAEKRGAHSFLVNGQQADAKHVAQAVAFYETKLAKQNPSKQLEPYGPPKPPSGFKLWWRGMSGSLKGAGSVIGKVGGRIGTWVGNTPVGKAVGRVSKKILEKADSVPAIRWARKTVITDKAVVQGKVQVDVQGPVLTDSRLLMVTDPTLSSALHWGTMAALSVASIPRQTYAPALVAVTSGTLNTIAKLSLIPLVPISLGMLTTTLGAVLTGVASAGVAVATGGPTPLSRALGGTAVKLGSLSFLSLFPVVGDAARFASMAATLKQDNWKLVEEIEEPAAVKAAAIEAASAPKLSAPASELSAAAEPVNAQSTTKVRRRKAA